MNKTAITIIVLAVVVLGAYFVLKGPEATAPTEEMNIPSGETNEPVSPSSQMPVPGNEDVEEMQVAHMVAYTNAGFSPSNLTIKVGNTVTFQNESTQNVWVASAMHPTHMLYSGTSLSAHCPDPANIAFDACEATSPGEPWSFTFTKAGTWTYHDHLHPTLFGKIVVE